MQEYSDNCKKCSLCHLIELNNLPSLKIIAPDGNFIKKEQILELKYLFAKDSQYTKENIYIIKNAEKMNKESANTMLKFLEEPEGNVIGFFLTNHKDNVMLTIRSRCELLEINFDNTPWEKYNIDEDKYNSYLNIIEDYLYKIEIEKKELILYNKKCLEQEEKEDIKIMLQIILDLYKDKLESLVLNKENSSQCSFLDKFSLKNLQSKINLIIELLKEINYNVNFDLLLDRFVLEMDGINNESI